MRGAIFSCVLTSATCNSIDAPRATRLQTHQLDDRFAPSPRSLSPDRCPLQPARPIKTDNSTAQGVISGTIKQKRSKAIDVRFCWLRDRVDQGQFRVCWDAGKNNAADYPTKHHSGKHHWRWRPVVAHVEGESPATMQGCVKTMAADQNPGSPGLPRSGQNS